MGDTGLGASGVASSSNGPLLSLAPKGATQLHHAQLAPRYRRENANLSPGTSPPHLRISDADRTSRCIIGDPDRDHRTCKCTTSLRQWRGLGTWKTASPLASPMPRVDRSAGGCIVAVLGSINLKSCPQKEVYENEVKRSVSHGGKQETYHLSDLKHDPRELRVCRTQASILSWLLGGLGLIVVPSISAT